MMRACCSRGKSNNIRVRDSMCCYKTIFGKIKLAFFNMHGVPGLMLNQVFSMSTPSIFG